MIYSKSPDNFGWSRKNTTLAGLRRARSVFRAVGVLAWGTQKVPIAELERALSHETEQPAWRLSKGAISTRIAAVMSPLQHGKGAVRAEGKEVAGVRVAARRDEAVLAEAEQNRR
jgi:hypothetical protein